MSGLNITSGHIARHTPRGAGSQGREAAVIDIAQDLLLRRLYEEGVLDSLAIKGGTALRKLYAGREGRFSLDLDFAALSDREQAQDSFILAVDGLEIGPFRYGAEERRGKWSITLESSFVSDSTLKTKLDFSPMPWLEPAVRRWAPLPIHKQYGVELPRIKTVRLEENIAEKIARLNRTTTARDMYDLAWVMRTAPVASTLDLLLIRRLAVLKNWVDANGMHSAYSAWAPGHEAFPFDPECWLRPRGESEFDMQDIGALAVPVPSAAELSEEVRREFAFLADLDEGEAVLAQSNGKDRALAIQMMRDLPGGRLRDAGLY